MPGPRRAPWAFVPLGPAHREDPLRLSPRCVCHTQRRRVLLAASVTGRPAQCRGSRQPPGFRESPTGQGGVVDEVALGLGKARPQEGGEGVWFRGCAVRGVLGQAAGVPGRGRGRELQPPGRLLPLPLQRCEAVALPQVSAWVCDTMTRPRL